MVGAVMVAVGTHSQHSRVTLGSQSADVGYRHAKGKVGSPQFHTATTVSTLGGSPLLLVLRCYFPPLFVVSFMNYGGWYWATHHQHVINEGSLRLFVRLCDLRLAALTETFVQCNNRR